MYLDLFLSELANLALLVGQQLLKLFPLLVQILIPILQKLVLILILEPGFFLRFTLDLPVPNILKQAILVNRPRHRFLPVAPTIGLTQHTLFILLIDDQQLLSQILVELHEFILSHLPIFLPGYPVSLLQRIGLFPCDQSLGAPIEILSTP